MREAWHRLSSREQRMVAAAACLVLVALAWIGIWRPMNADIARLTRDVPRLENLASLARSEADDIVALARVATTARADPLPAAERVLAERNLRAAVSGLDMQEGRLRMTFAMVRFDAVPPLVDALARAGLLPTDITLQPRVEPGFVRAELAFKVSR
jgi:type II secretory pathway component PulM